MKEKTRKGIKYIVITAAALLLGAGIFYFADARLRAQALFNPDLAIEFGEFKTKTTVEDSVLFIGTYIIHKDALTDQLYEKANTSAADSGQDEVFYKSELADGKWFNTGNIENGIKGITSEGLPVEEEVLDPLYVTYYVGADGIMRDARTMDPVNPFDVPDPYDLSKLPELNPIWMQYTLSETATEISQEDFLKNRNSADNGNLRSDVYYYQLLSTFFSLDLQDEETKKYDDKLAALNETYINLKAAGAEDEAKLVFSLMEKVDATRRMLIMERLSEIDTNLLNTLYTLSTGSYYTPYGSFKDSSSEENASEQAPYTIELEDSLMHEDTTAGLPPWIGTWLKNLGLTGNSDDWWAALEKGEEERKRRVREANEDNDDYVEDQSSGEFPFAVDNSLLESIGTAMGNCSDSYNTYRSKALVDTDDVLGHVIYDYSSQVIDQASATAVGGPITLLKHATNIQDNIVNDKAGEKDLLTGSLLSLGISKYEGAANEGPADGYAALSSEAAKKSFLEDQKASMEGHRSTIQFLIEAYRQREEPADALAYVNGRISATESLIKGIPDTDFKTMATSSAEAHLVWLKEEAQKIIDSDESLKSKLDSLKDKKDELQKKRDEALDNNDLSGAAAYDAKIAAVDQDIADERAKNGSGDGSDGDGSGSGGDGSGGSGGDGGASAEDALADQLIDKAMDKLADDANADLSDIADALAGLGEDEKLDKLAEKAKASGASADTMKGIEKASGKAAEGKGDIDADTLIAMLEDLFGKDVDDMSDSELAIATTSMSKVAKSDVNGAQKATNRLANKMIGDGNKYLYRQLGDDKATEYINLKTLSQCTSFRYFYDDNRRTATMTSGAKIYIFKNGSDKMQKGSEGAEEESMKSTLKVSLDPYLGEDDCKTYFGCGAEYISGTDYGICLSSVMQSKAEEYAASMLESLAE